MYKQMTIIPASLLTVTMLTGCPSTLNMKTVEVDVIAPAEITLPSGIENFLIIDRTGYNGNPFDSDEAILMKEVAGEDREAVQTLIFFLQRYLGGSPRFQPVVAGEVLSGNSFSGLFPQPIPWETVRELCRRYQTNALVAIEVYRSDYNVSTPRQGTTERPLLPETQPDPYSVRQHNQYYQYTVRGAGNILFGFRVYDPVTETIVDEILSRHNETWDATGPDPASAVAGLIRREQAIGELIHLAGIEYARRIAPIPIPVPRSYYGESSKAPAMAAGTALAESGRWQAAADAWEAGISQAPETEAGQLAYNVAIAYEKLGNTEKAREWAETASGKYGNRQAMTYQSELGILVQQEDTLDISGGGQIQLPGVNIGTQQSIP